MAEEDGQEVVFKTDSKWDQPIGTTSNDPLVLLIRDVRKRVQAGEGDAVLAEAAAESKEAKWVLATAEAKLRMGALREGRDSAREAADLFSKLSNVRGESLALQVQADCHLSLHECAEVLDLSVRAVTLAWELGDKAAEACMMHSCASAFQLQWRHPEAVRAANRAATLFREAGDKMGEAIALQTAANASVSRDPREVGAAKDNSLLKESASPPGGQAAMDAVRFGQTSILYDKKQWQPISKYELSLVQRESMVVERGKEGGASVVGMGLGENKKPLFQHKSFPWRKAAHKVDQAWYHMVLTAGDKIV